MKTAIVFAQIILASMLVLAILLQARGSGLGSVWGASNASYHSKRGVEKILFFATIVFASLFLLSSVFNILMQQ